MDYKEIVQGTIDQHKDSPIDMLNNGGGAEEYEYLNLLKKSYTRTVSDVDKLWNDDDKGKNILEIGSFLGVTSISLKKLGHNVSASDIPEFYESESLRSLYEKNDIHFSGLNLKGDAKLPYEDNSFDAVIICEVIEHFNFNPLLVLKEINRVLKKGGFLYIGMPNQARIANRLKLLFGKSVRNPIDDYFKQFDRNSNAIVGLHWREYTLAETVEMIERMGFETTQAEYFLGAFETFKPNLKSIIGTIVYAIPSFRAFQVVVGKKVKVPDYDFWLTDANT